MNNDIKSFSVGYNPINKSNIFRSGDCITGQISLELAKECKIVSLWVKLKGKAQVKWTEHYGKTSVTYHSKDKYFSVKQHIIQDVKGDNIVGGGCHVYPFTFQIPSQDLPSSFKGSHGKIKYTLKANLSRKMKVDSKAKTKFTMVHIGNSDSSLMIPQRNTVEKKMNIFTSGSVSMDVNIERTALRQGEGIKIMASIYNKSSREIKPKYCLYKKYSYFAMKRRKVETKDIVKEVGEPVPPSTSQTVTRTIIIPPTTCASIYNCKIIKAEYRLRVYLDVKYARDPGIKFPIVILPALEGPEEERYSAYDSETFAQPPPYGAHEMYPSFTDFHRKS
ncbi:arrestin domain-containing protein 3-like [Antennarius striatus]|uniref:arrestin domain-containing protein 3-like n=1 Tax=Antennarius striatus TaxID=241820 RepID=UPI0035AEDC1C